MTTRARQCFPLPIGAPLFPSPPSAFREVTCVGALLRLPEGVARQLVAEPLEPLDDLLYVNWMYAGDVDGYKDMHIIDMTVPVEYEGTVGRHCALEYIDCVWGMSIGRELWSFPKKTGAIVWEESDDGIHLECRPVDRLTVGAPEESLIVEMDFRFGDADAEAGADWPQQFGVADEAPYLQVRQVMAEDRTSARAEVVRVGMSYGEFHESRAGTGTLQVQDGPQDPVASMLGRVEVLGARMDRMEFDFAPDDDAGSVIGSVEIAAEQGRS
ncbi:acetoacetate decarboxylase family protein [Capillimicrobium parvum]|uniref:Acetoacetate decarboxylase n=1 Tax=Capillimicrobium parvum TaxID=2884022 RepID=A0A9E6XU15_9ACTN|nr:acetoacetate decarboxylase family protein [Capillimicrobium parvum]UGS34384.1 acetoacetate decarboxylase [Capillimicrobium parvum]